MDSRNQEFVDTLLADVLSDRQLAQLALDPGERRDVQQRVVQQAEASTQASVVATEAIRLANQYDVEARLLQEVLELSGLPLDSLSSKAQLSTSLIANLCSVLGVTRPGMSEMLAAWAQLKLRESKAAVLQAKLQQHSADMEKDAARARSRLEQLKQALARVQHQQQAAERRARSEAQQVTELGVKQQEYARSLDKCARKLAANGVTPEIHHSTLVERSAALQELQSRAAELQEQLASYHNLPTSVLGASMMLKQARERLQAAQERLESGLADL